MRLNRHSLPKPSPSRWRQFVEFCHRHWPRIVATIALALAVDYLGGRMLQHNLADVYGVRALVGIAVLFSGCTALAWAAGSRASARPTPANPAPLLTDFRYVGLFLTIVGVALTIDDPKNIFLLLGPVILLDLIRLRRADEYVPRRLHIPMPRRSIPTLLTGAAYRLRATNGALASSLAPLLMIPIVTTVVILYAWPFNSLEFHETWEIWCLALSFAGLGIRMLAAGQSSDAESRSASYFRAPTLDTAGIFSIVRYPRYLGDYFIGLGVVLIPFVWWMPVLYSVAFHLYYKRLATVEDERLLSEFGERFVQWAAATPAIVPRVFRRRPMLVPSASRCAASGSFSFRTALKYEYAGIFLVIFLHSSVEWLEHLFLERRVMLELFWIIVALAGLTACLLVRYLAKYTRVLNAPAS